MNIDKIVNKITKHFLSFGIALKLTLLERVNDDSRLIFDVKVKKGTKISQLFDRAKDIRIALGLSLFQLFWESQAIRLAVSNSSVSDNSLRKMLTNTNFRNNRMRIPIAIGYDMRGRMFFADLIAFVHAMYGGATNSGKTVGLQSLIISIAAIQPVSRVNLIIIDAYTNKLNLFDPLPHLVLPVINAMDEAVAVLQEIVREMERRLKLPINELRLLPALVCVIDEYINLIKNIGTKKSVLKGTLESLLMLGRQAKIHVILATQEPGKEDMQISLNNIIGRMAFTCSDFYGSRSILGESGAEKLPGNGAMLFKSPAQPKPIPLQGAFMPTAGIERLTAHIAAKHHDLSNKFVIPELNASQFLKQITEVSERKSSNEDRGNKELTDIIMWTLGQVKVSAEKMKQYFRMGNRASDIMDKLCGMNLIADKFSNQPRAVIPQALEDISDDVIELLSKNGFSNADMVIAIKKRFED